ncbi:MAG TPA: 50S ribosomal protein L4 [Spirochaetales bacterium]|nr:50S ribosomal protein L4 [Spirochaetales bacterium]HOV39107.1 50S ribosomal protein L4 [Spirochaetales bacterium]
MEQKVYSITGQELRTIELSDSVFNTEVNDAVIYYAVVNEQANARVGTASTKTRAEVKGSSRKPWKQKGTGRARAGRRRSPLWVGGGIVFGPKPRDYGYILPKKVKQAAYRSLLSLKVKEQKIKIIEDFTIDSGKTKDLISILKNLVPEERSVLILKDDDGMLRRAGSNLPWLTLLSYNRLNANDLFYGKNILILETAAQNLNSFYGEG